MNGVSREESSKYIDGAAVRKERVPKIRLLWGTCGRVKEEDDIRTQEEQ